MGLIEMASGNSIWRGMDYYKKQKKLLLGRSQGLILMMVKFPEVGITNILYILIRHIQENPLVIVPLRKADV